MAGVTDASIASAYGSSAAAWADGPDRLYGDLAEALVAACPPLVGREVLDIGAGTGAQSRAITAVGARVGAAVDISHGMLVHGSVRRPPAVVADAASLPFESGVFDAALAGFVVNHVTDPTVVLREAARVTRRGGLVAASSFDATWSHPAKQAVDDAAAQFGYRPPSWYLEVKARSMPVAGDPRCLAAAARDAGLTEVQAFVHTMDSGLQAPREMVAWRLGMAHLAPFVAGLSATARQELVASAVAALGHRPPPVQPQLVLLVARA